MADKKISQLTSLGVATSSDLFPIVSPQCPKPHGIFEHGQNQGNGGMGTDNLSFEALLNQIRQQADMIDVRMGQKNEIHLSGFDRPLFNRNGRIPPLNHPAVNEDRMPSNLHQPARPGNTPFTAQMPYFEFHV